MGRISFIKASVLVSATFGLIVVAGGVRLSGQTAGQEADQFEAGAGVHETRAQSKSSFQLPSMNELSPERETVLALPLTRSCFMTTWRRVSGASGYLLDVSVSSAFNSFVEGYHDLDVGDVNGRVVTD
jgi:hypothetical protein